MHTPLVPHCYIVKLGYAVVYLVFLFLIQHIDCGYSLEPSRRVPTIYVLSKIMFFFTTCVKCILLGRVFGMSAKIFNGWVQTAGRMPRN